MGVFISGYTAGHAERSAAAPKAHANPTQRWNEMYRDTMAR